MNSHDRASDPDALESEAGFPMMASRVDLLSQVLALIRLRGELVFSAELSAPWGLRFDAGSAHFHIVLNGEMELEASGGARARAATGDLLVLLLGRGHLIGASAGDPLPAREVLERQVSQGSLSIGSAQAERRRG